MLRAYPKPLCGLLDRSRAKQPELSLARILRRLRVLAGIPRAAEQCGLSQTVRIRRANSVRRGIRPRLTSRCAEDRNPPCVASWRARARDAHIVAPWPVTSELLAREFPALVLIRASGASHGGRRRTEDVRAIAFHVAARRPRAGDGVHVIPSWPKATALALLDPIVAGTVLACVQPGRRASLRGAKRHRRTAPQRTPSPGRQC